MTSLRHCLRGFALFLCIVATPAHAITYTGKLASYQVYSNSNGSNVSVYAENLGTLYAYDGQADILREAFLRKLTVTLTFNTVPCPPAPSCYQISLVTIKTSDLP